MVSTIGKVWEDAGKKLKFKVRYQDWNYRIKFFTIDGLSGDSQRVLGTLDTGEVISYAIDNQGWQEYKVGLENIARAV